MEEHDEKPLAERLRKMDPDAWTSLCRECGPRLFAFVRYRLGYGREEAEEAVQMTFLQCLRFVRQFNPDRGRLTAWLWGIARNEAHRLKRKERRHPAPISIEALPEPVRAQLAAHLDSAPLPDELLIREDVQTLTLSALERLPKNYRDALVMKYMEGSSVNEIARELGSTEKAVESTLSRAREAFRRVFLEASAATGEVAL